MKLSTKGLWCVIASLFVAAALNAQDKAQESEPLALVSTSSKNINDQLVYNFNFRTDHSDVVGKASSFMKGYDSISLSNYEFVNLNDEKVLKVEGYIIDKQSGQQLKWLAAVDYQETPILQISNDELFSAKFIQFGAFDNLEYAKTELLSLEGFDIKMVLINGQYKLIAPYSKDDYKRARYQYADKDVWAVEYKQQAVVSNDY